MVELLHADAVEPTAVYERAPGRLELHELHPREAAVVRVAVPRDQLQGALAEAMGEVSRGMNEAGVPLAGPPFARYLSFDATRVVAEIGFPVIRPAPRVGRVEPVVLPGGLAASMIHLGGYERIAETYQALHRAIAEIVRHPTGPGWEVYWSDPAAEPDPSTWRTELLIPIA